MINPVRCSLAVNCAFIVLHVVCLDTVEIFRMLTSCHLESMLMASFQAVLVCAQSAAYF